MARWTGCPPGRQLRAVTRAGRQGDEATDRQARAGTMPLAAPGFIPLRRSGQAPGLHQSIDGGIDRARARTACIPPYILF
ncbi:MAG: hypothetical protein AVDCRST_MAG87-2368 [uncultured Thermomicrobiales bacterium]|uniref:Uncharacterized protein n=1 Tax=uncultured Thermomicrobiales bacterium TaxID=1645740 RepID=A0A6J4V984_9BACT|nr:MAG: hypothetical protein AVDCRST_MAG87-2368 [uncultured Thermomicrobiales bacterium]